MRGFVCVLSYAGDCTIVNSDSRAFPKKALTKSREEKMSKKLTKKFEKNAEIYLVKSMKKTAPFFFSNNEKQF